MYALAAPLRLTEVVRVTVPAVLPQLVKLLSTPPFCAKLLAGTEELDEDELLDDELVLELELELELELLEPPHNAPVTAGACGAAPPLVP